MKLGHNIDHEETVNGLTYRVAKSDEDIRRVADFYFDIMIEGEKITSEKRKAA